MDYWERKKILSGIQGGGRQNRSTLAHLVRMEQEVRKAFAVNEHLVSIYFDLEKAYDNRESGYFKKFICKWNERIFAKVHGAVFTAERI